jgi:hypothetical protein
MLKTSFIFVLFIITAVFKEGNSHPALGTKRTLLVGLFVSNRFASMI